METKKPLEIDVDLDTPGEKVALVKIEIVKEFDTGPLRITCRETQAEAAPVKE